MKPIIFSTPMVKAILEGRKTQTRWVVKPRNKRKAKQLEYRQGYGLWVHGYNDKHIAKREAYGSIKDYSVSPMWMDLDVYIRKYAPCKPGDILYVKEAWQQCENDSYIFFEDALYKNATMAWPENELIKLKSPLFMPKEAARIFLRIDDVRVERLQDITPEDCRSEGITATAYANFEIPAEIHELKKTSHFPMHRHVGNESGIIDDSSPWWRIWYRCLWDSINAKRGHPWESNPWVFVYTFEKIEKP